MIYASKTLNPLHFEDLEPHRFEDLVRQLVYDFRRWKSIEATGRLGQDEGIDIKAVEIIESDEASVESTEGEEETALPPRRSERVWVIQCKREKSITPKRIPKIVEKAVPTKGDVPYGFILAAACDFSKKSRDAFYDSLGKKGVQEFYLWGRGELEDMLFLPKNDHLLFAYFNISLAVRRRSLKSQIRSRLATKRKLVNILGGVTQESFKPVLVRDANDVYYPYKGNISDFDEFPRWKHYIFLGHHPLGLRLIVFTGFAYLDDEGKKWDAIFDFNDAPAAHMGSMSYDERGEFNKKRERCLNFWRYKIPEKNRATFETVRFIDYASILGVDKHGDMYNRNPHIYVEFDRKYGPFVPDTAWEIIKRSPGTGELIRPKLKDRVEFFPKKIPKVKPPKTPNV